MERGRLALSLLLCEYNPSSVGRYRPSLNHTWIIDYWTNISYLFKKMTGNGNGMGMGMKSLKWEGIGTKNLFPHTSFRYNTGLGLSDRQTDRHDDSIYCASMASRCKNRRQRCTLYGALSGLPRELA